MREHRFLRTLFWAGLFLAATGLAWTLTPPRELDVSYSPFVRRRAYGRRGPHVLIDEAHWNTHTAHGLYRPFARLLAVDGYRVSRNRQPLVPALLETCDVLVISNPRGLHGFRFGGQAFDSREVDALLDWIRQGGGLLLVADGATSIEATRSLVRSFGAVFEASTVFGNSDNPDSGSHPIRSGRDGFDEKVRRIVLTPGPAVRITTAAPREIVPKRSIALESAKGRIVILTDAAALTARIVNGERVGINMANSGNRQFALNIAHWLSKLI